MGTDMRQSTLVSVARAVGIGSVAFCALHGWPAAAADIVDELNAIRAQGCGGLAGLANALTHQPRLDEAAGQLQRTRDLGTALRSVQYRAVKASAVMVGGSRDEASLVRRAVERNCVTLLDSAFREIGVHRTSDALWIILAVPFDFPAAADGSAVGNRVLELVNEARRAPRVCGDRSFSPSQPLVRNALLDRAALRHAQSMAASDYMDHTGHDGSSPADRINRAGYRWRRVGENVAAGPTTAEVVMAGWLESPGHCANIMSPAFTEMGIAFAVNRQGRQGVYWAQVFGTPR